MTPYQAGLLCNAIYPPFTAGFFLQTFQNDAVTCGYGIDPDGNKTFSFAGSHDKRDFEDDALAIPIHFDRLGGHVHMGFSLGIAEMFDDNLRALLKPGDIVTTEGHSLGAPHAGYFAALCKSIGVRIRLMTLLESPRPGYADHCAYVRSNCDYIRSYKNARDPVVDMPLNLEALPFEHYIEPTDLNSPADSLDPFEDHMIKPVLKGLSILK